ncbi:InlB B-repeat-containing protein [Candidatus Saccharibacteria bacterium]|nr:InlB B-repeat-containing protein [Candidatus Saccharibacteria bacterium]MBR3256659.1 InlB B-repeat-containing protein [Candidatus Saccharibacteria bacterium]
MRKLQKFLINLVLSLLTLLGGHLIFGTPVFAATTPTISINLSTLAPLDLMPGHFGSTSQTVSITTNNYTGYTAVLSNPVNSTDLVNTTDNTLVIPTITLPQGSSSITSSAFDSGYGISTDGTNFVPSPTTATNMPIGSNNAAGTNSHTLTFGAKPAADTISGSYVKTFVVAAVVNNMQYSITYNKNAGSDTVSGMPNDQGITITTTDTITLPNDVPTREYYTFLGWDTDPTATTPTYPTGSTNTISLDPTLSNATTLYAIWGATGTVQITNVSYVSGTNVLGTPNPTVDSSGNVNFDLTFKGGLDNNSTLQAIYRITVTNTTPSDYSFTAPASNLTLRISPTEVRDISYELSGIAVGDTIPGRGGSVTFDMILNTDYVSGEHSAEGGIDVEPVDQTTPSLVGSIYGSNTGDLSGSNTLTPFQITVESTFEESNTFTINSLSSDFEIVNSSGNPLGAQSIAAGATTTYTFYMKKASGAQFASETATAGITISYNSTYTNVGEVKIKVDKDPSYHDDQAPTISGVTITRDKATDGRATLSWTGTDNVGVASYGIYKCTNICDNMISVSGVTNSYTFSNLSDGTYHFIVVGYDDEGNTATQNQINSANTDPGPASSTGNQSLSWLYNVSYNIRNGGMTNTSGTTVRAGGTWQGTVTANQGYVRPDSKNDFTVTMDNNPYTDFTYNTNNYQVQVSNASGDISISATLEQSCLIAGTLIPVLDENGNETTKPIEDITYKDLVKVWNHETGTIDYQHPARIEKASVKPYYQLATLDDGTTLGTFGWHGVFDVEANEFISVDDSIKFHEGVEIYKVEGDQLIARKVEKVEIINQEVTVYHLLSSQYYNVVANDILTTDGFTLTSNFYGFTDHNIMWPEARNEFLSHPENLYTYEDFADIGVPLRMFNDLRLREASYLQRYGITLEMFKQYLTSQGVISGMVPYDDE